MKPTGSLKKRMIEKGVIKAPPLAHPDGGIIDDPMFTPGPNDGDKGAQPRPLARQLNPEDDVNLTAPAADLAAITALATGLQNLQKRIEQGEQLLKQLKEKEYKIQTETLPAMMEQLNLKDFTLTDGSKIVVSAVTAASIPSESAINSQKDAEKAAELRDKYARGMAFLKAQGAESIIKLSLKADLGKDSEKLAEKAVAALKKMGIPAAVSRGVHPQTLTAWVRERLATGADLDFDALSIYTGSKAEIKTQKRK